MSQSVINQKSMIQITTLDHPIDTITKWLK